MQKTPRRLFSVCLGCIITGSSACANATSPSALAELIGKQCGEHKRDQQKTELLRSEDTRDIFQAPGCLGQGLVLFFTERFDPCGHCQPYTGLPPKKAPRTQDGSYQHHVRAARSLSRCYVTDVARCLSPVFLRLQRLFAGPFGCVWVHVCGKHGATAISEVKKHLGPMLQAS